MKLYARVTDILAQLQDFGNINPEVLAAKAKLGTQIHAAIDAHVAGEFYTIPSEKAQKYFDSYLKWGSKHVCEYVEREKRLFDDQLMITGQFDGLVNFRDKQHVLIDYKTSYKASPDIWILQAHFYWYLCNRNGIPAGDTMQWINLNRTGTEAKVYEFTFSEGVLFKCIELANQFWENYNNAKNHE